MAIDEQYVKDLELSLKNVSVDNDILSQALLMVAEPSRHDGTWNRTRHACQKIADDAIWKVHQRNRVTHNV